MGDTFKKKNGLKSRGEKEGDFDQEVRSALLKTVPLTESQIETWHSCALTDEDTKTVHNESSTRIFDGEVNTQALEKAMAALVSRHESLRAVFSPNGENMLVYNNISYHFPFKDFSHFPQHEKKKELQRVLSGDLEYAFDLANGPLFKATLVKLGEREHHFIFTGHRLIIDSWSIRFVIEELWTLYAVYVQGLDPQLTDPKPFNEYPKAQLEHLEKLEDWNDTQKDFPLDTPFILFIRNIVSKNPEKVAIEYHDRAITYAELEEKSNQIANFLVNKGVNREDIIGVYTHRSPEMIMLLLGILKAGGAYLPLDPVYPRERIEYMFQDSKAKLLIADESLQANFGTGAEELTIEGIWNELEAVPKTLPNTLPNGKNLAYVLYTSGSTGNPKGVQIEHRNLTNFLLSMQIAPGMKETDRILAITTISFDIAGLELFLPLITGATIVLADTQTARDGMLLLQWMEEKNITYMQATPTTWRMLISVGWKKPLPLKILCGGESLPDDLAEKLLANSQSVWNVYGPTETTVWSTAKELSKSDSVLTIGRPIHNTQVYLMDENRNLVPQGEVGEIYIGGDGVARGYLNRPELTSERFFKDTLSKTPKARIYRTGDLGKFLDNGEIVCLGRVDHQVKIRGHRIEMGEIENVITKLPGIHQAAVVAKSYEDDQKYLVLYYKTNDSSIDQQAIRGYLTKNLPEYMLPSIYMKVEDFPTTSNGKIDRKALPNPVNRRSDLKNVIKRPKTEDEKALSKIFQKLLNFDEIGVNDNFFELGGNSLSAQKLVAEIRSVFGKALPVTKIYQYPDISQLVPLLSEKKTEIKEEVSVKSERHSQTSSGAIAVIGMAGRFPGADDIDTFWDNLINERESIANFSPEELDPSIPENIKNAPNYVPARGIIKDADQFDYQFFGISRAHAELMDPQHRLFLEISWEALEKTRTLSKGKQNKIGVFAGTNNNTYFQNNIIFNQKIMERYGDVQISSLNEKDYIAMRVAYQFDLKGPAMSVYSACSTSLLAISQAVLSIRSGQCEVALAGGSTVTPPIKSGHLYQEGAIFSSNSRCKPFDAKATGTLFCDGAGVVVLKDFNQAVEDGDTIYAKILGIGVNNDGSNKGSFSAPSAEGQAEAIRMAHSDANVHPSAISYVEAHGTATPLGDPIEVEGLKLAFGTQSKSEYCGIGSVKSNIGHLTAAAGVAGFIKTVLSLYHQKIPASLGFEKLNPVIDLDDSPFYVHGKTGYWKGDYPRKAGVSSLGIGGTNVHVIIEEHINQETPSDEDRGTPKILSFSANTEKSLSLYAGKLHNWLDKKQTVNLADVAYSINTKNHDFPYKGYLVFSDREDLMTQLVEKAIPKQNLGTINSIPDQVIFLFPGQGSQYLNMGKELYEANSVFKNAIDTCSRLFDLHLDRPLLDVIYPTKLDEDAEALLKDTKYTQPAIFAIEYALAKVWLSWGVNPTGFCGHSIGEYVAAYLSGILSLEDATKLVAIRGKLISELSRGDMISIRAPQDVFQGKLTEGLSIAAVNSPNLCVVAGSSEEIDPFTKKLDEEGILFKKLFTSHAFHSSMMDPILETFKDEVGKVNLQAPKLPIYSTVTGLPLKGSEAMDPGYWTNHLRATVQFSAAITYITMESDDVLFLEVGPGNGLSSLIKQHQTAKSTKLVNSLDRRDSNNEFVYLVNQLGQFLVKGGNLQWEKYYGNEKRKIIDVPTYAFNKTRCWIDVIDRFPLLAATTSEKVSEAISEQVSSPMTKHQQKIQEIWQRLLGVNNIGLHDDFFELGGDSLIAVNLMIRLEMDTGKRLPLNSLFQNPRLEDFAKLFEGSNESEEQEKWSCFVPIKPSGSKPPIYLIHAAGSHVSTYYLLAKKLDVEQPVFGLQAKGLNGIDDPITTIEEIAAHYIAEIIKHNPNGPYYIGGHSFGGYVAFEMAKQLKRMNRKVERVIMFDIDAYQWETLPSKWQKLKGKLAHQLQKRYVDINLLFNHPDTFMRLKKSSMERKKTKLMGFLKGNNIGEKSEVALTIEKIRKINHHAMDNYLLSPYDGDIYLFRAKIENFYIREKKFYGWKPYVNNVHMIDMDGDHNSMFEEPLVVELAKKVQMVLNG